jgi:hypothetical protein
MFSKRFISHFASREMAKHCRSRLRSRSLINSMEILSVSFKPMIRHRLRSNHSLDPLMRKLTPD